MEKYILLFALIIVSPMTYSHAQANLFQDFIPNKFEKRIQLEVWSKTSSFGGGKLTELQGQKGKYFIVDRCHTSGVQTSEVIIYREENDFIKMVYYLPLKRFFRSYKINNGVLTIREPDIEIKIDESQL